MINIVKTISTELDSLQRRVVKILRLGKSDTQTADQIAPHGIDSNPIKDMMAVYADTGEKGDKVILGYLNKNQVAAPGEFRIFSVNADGELQTFIWLKADGTILMGGDAKNMVRFQELKTGFDELKSNHNDLVSAFNAHMHATAGSGAPSPPTPASGIPAQPSTASIDDSKIDEIKTL